MTGLTIGGLSVIGKDTSAEANEAYWLCQNEQGKVFSLSGRRLRRGSPYFKREIDERFWEKVDKNGPWQEKFDSACWLWTGALLQGEYGYFTVIRGQTVLAHRWTYERVNGLIQKGLTIDHLCFNKACVNPKHLEAVSLSENIKRYAASITACKHGHKYTEANTYIGPNGNRRCRECHRQESKRYQERTATRK